MVVNVNSVNNQNLVSIVFICTDRMEIFFFVIILKQTGYKIFEKNPQLNISDQPDTILTIVIPYNFL